MRSCSAVTVMYWSSDVAKAWSGTKFGRALPIGRGTSPFAKYSARRVVAATSVDWN